MYAYLRETDDSTTVNYSAYGKFLPGNAGNQLLTVGAKYLRIFRTNPYALVPPRGSQEEWQQRTRLECVFSHRLLSAPQSLSTVRLPGNSTDSLLVAFDDAKLSIIGVGERERKLETQSLHFFEQDSLKDGYTANVHPPVVKTDPGHRCAAMLVYGRHLTVIPLIDGQAHIRSFTVTLSDIDPRLDNILDMVFLDGYYEPTLLLLYEPQQTTAGRAAVRFDTMCIMGVSVNVLDQQVAVVWQLSGLPMDVQSLLSIPKPIGGAVLWGANSVIYLNQAVPPCGIVLNSNYDNFTKFPLKKWDHIQDMRDLVMTLDCSTATWLSEGRVLMGTMDGRIFVLNLLVDSAFAVKSLEFKHIFETSTPYCMTVCAPGHIFIGSRLGDSQLFQYSIIKKDEKSLENGVEAKKARLDENGKAEPEDVDEIDLELYGDFKKLQQKEEGSDSVDRLEFSFVELDRLTNVGPMKTMTAGGAHGTSRVLLDQPRLEPVFDIVAASGHGKDGALCVLQRTVRPEIITSSDLDGAQQMWAVGQHEDGSHRYLLVSRTRSTLVLELDEEMVELEEPLFITDEPTVAAGELADGGLAVQVTSQCIALVAGGAQLQEVQLDSTFPVIAASIVDPFVALLMQNGKLMLFQLAAQPHVHLKEMIMDESTAALFSAVVTSVSIYKDMSGMMVCQQDGREDGHARASTSHTKGGHSIDMDLYGESVGIDIEDLMLYGDASRSKGAQKDKEESRKRKRGVVSSAVGGEESDAVDPNTVEPTYWLVVGHDNGRLVIHSLPDLTVVYQISKFAGMPEILFDTTAEDEEKERKEIVPAVVVEGEAQAQELRPEEKIVEVQIVGMGISQCRPVLFGVIDDTVVAYEMYPCDNEMPEHMCIAWRRLPLTICLRSSPYMGADGRRTEVQICRDQAEVNQRTIVHPFERISSVLNGVMIGGAFPCLVVMGAWGGLRHHPLTLDGPLRSFTPFNNQNVLNGFLYLTDDSQELRVAQIRSDVDYELPYPCKKVHVGATVHHVRYMMQSQVYAVTTSLPEKSNKIWVVVNDDKQEEIHEKDPHFVLPTIHKYRLQLYSPDDWAPVPNTEITFDDMETVTACEEVALRSESTMSGLQTYLVVGTVNNYGEEVLVRGRIIMAELIEVVPEPGMPTSKHKIKVLYDKEQKGPVTAICSLNGFLLCGMGQKLFVWGFKDNELQGVSFLDLHYYIHSLHSMRTLAVACDAQRSISLIRFQEQYKALSVASRDDRICKQSPMDAQFLVDEEKVGMLVSDESGNIQLFNYLPEQRDAVGGEKLILRAIINIGTNVNCWIRVKGNTSMVRTENPTDERSWLQQHSTLWSSLDGSFGYIRPIPEKIYRRLQHVQTYTAQLIPQAAGLNPKGARSARPPRAIANSQSAKAIVDGDIVEQFMHLSTADKQDLARRFGASRYQIMDDIVQVTRLAAYF